ncbi:hypothetical protein MMC19_003508 [Ptychographa xylographoides]|nr:hypothetical protein [Ptychographa xylographoides]
MLGTILLSWSSLSQLICAQYTGASSTTTTSTIPTTASTTTANLNARACLRCPPVTASVFAFPSMITARQYDDEAEESHEQLISHSFNSYVSKNTILEHSGTTSGATTPGSLSSVLTVQSVQNVGSLGIIPQGISAAASSTKVVDDLRSLQSTSPLSSSFPSVPVLGLVGSSNSVLSPSVFDKLSLSSTTSASSAAASDKHASVASTATSSVGSSGTGAAPAASSSTFQLYVKSPNSGLNTLAVALGPNGNTIIGGNLVPTILTINGVTNLKDPNGNFLYFVTTSPTRRFMNKKRALAPDTTLQYSTSPPVGAIMQGFFLANGVLGVHTTTQDYSFYICTSSPDAQPIYVTVAGTAPTECYPFELVIKPPPLPSSITTTSSMIPTTLSTSTTPIAINAPLAAVSSSSTSPYSVSSVSMTMIASTTSSTTSALPTIPMTTSISLTAPTTVLPISSTTTPTIVSTTTTPLSVNTTITSPPANTTTTSPQTNMTATDTPVNTTTALSPANSTTSAFPDLVSSATSIIVSQSLYVFCSQLLGYSTPISVVSSTTTATATSTVSNGTAFYTIIYTSTRLTTVPSSTSSPTVIVTVTSTTVTAHVSTSGITMKKRMVRVPLNTSIWLQQNGFNRRQISNTTSNSNSSSISTPSALSTFGATILSSACSQEVYPINMTSTSFYYSVSTVTSTTTVPATSQAISVANSFTTQTISSGITTALTATTTATVTTTSTTTIVVQPGAPNGTQTYLQVANDPNLVTAYALSDPSTHLTDNYFFPSRREVFIVSQLGQLYSVTNNSYYYGTKPAGGDKLYWSTSSSMGNTTFYSRPLGDGTGRAQLFLNDTVSTPPAPFSFCVSNLNTTDSNAATGYHIYYYVTPSQVGVNCTAVQLYLQPVS